MTQPDLDLDGRVAVVVGSTSGIGRAVAHGFAREGARVVVNGRSRSGVETVVDEIRAAGGSAVGVPGSAARADVAASLLETAEAAYGPVDVLVTCAGTAEPPGSSILTIDVDDWDDLIDAHLNSTFLAARAIAPGMVERGRGSIVTTSSHAWTGMYGGTGYAAGKGGVVSLTYALAAELRGSGVRVNAVCPGARTQLSEGDDYTARIDDLAARGLIDDITRSAALDPAGPEYVVPLYLLLASPLGAHLTGEVLVAAGGYLGRFASPRDTFVQWRDHHDHGPWTPHELAGFLEGS